jgi:hypothetical protein
MSGSQSTNNDSLNFEKQQAAEADAKEAARQQRLTQGKSAIDAIFNGQPVMGTRQKTFDWSSFKPPQAGLDASGNPISGNAPSGYTAVYVPKASTPSTSKPGSGMMVTPRNTQDVSGRGAYTGYMPAASSAAGGGSEWALKDANGKIYRPGDSLTYSETYDTGQKTGGFDDAFYNKYKQQYLDYYLPDEAKQYAEAKRNANFNLARAGLLDSSAAGSKAADLSYQDTLAQATIQNQANQAVGDLQNQIAGEKQSLINQLYSTEDPTLTANLAQSAANADQLKSPTLTPVVAFFDPALTAAGSAAASYLNPNQPYVSPFTSAGGSTVANASGTGSSKLYKSS